MMLSQKLHLRRLFAYLLSLDMIRSMEILQAAGLSVHPGLGRVSAVEGVKQPYIEAQVANLNGDEGLEERIFGDGLVGGNFLLFCRS